MSNSLRCYQNVLLQLVAVLQVVGCGMRTLDLADEQGTSSSAPPPETAATNVSGGDTTVTTSSETSGNATTTGATSSATFSSDQSALDGGDGLPDAEERNCGPDKPYYDRASGNCLECRVDDNCDNGNICYPPGYCWPPCVYDYECPFEMLCIEPYCVQCRVSFDCKVRFDGELPVCDEATHWCRSCESDRECPSDAPVCGAFGRCITPSDDGPMSDGR
jgi:hypothetical protein